MLLIEFDTSMANEVDIDLHQNILASRDSAGRLYALVASVYWIQRHGKAANIHACKLLANGQCKFVYSTMV